MPTERYHVRLVKESLTFCAAHFITYAGNICERLHGHNYRVAVEVHGSLDDNYYVVDFIALRDSLRRIVEQLDHRMLLPTKHAQIHVHDSEREVEVKFADRRWVFPREDCVLLPVENTTAELLARHVAHQLRNALNAIAATVPRQIVVSIDECEGQWGVCELAED